MEGRIQMECRFGDEILFEQDNPDIAVTFFCQMFQLMYLSLCNEAYIGSIYLFGAEVNIMFNLPFKSNQQFLKFMHMRFYGVCRFLCCIDHTEFIYFE